MFSFYKSCHARITREIRPSKFNETAQTHSGSATAERQRLVSLFENYTENPSLRIVVSAVLVKSVSNTTLSS